MKFEGLKEWNTPRGKVSELAINGKIAWKKVVNVPISTLDVGSSVFLNVGGKKTDFIIVHQGLPSTSYDSSCNGTWLLMKNIYTKAAWDGTNNSYADSDIYAYLKNTFLNLFASNIRSIIKNVYIPFVNGVGTSSVSYYLSAKVFLLSAMELGWESGSYRKADGSCLTYFKDISNSKRIAYYNSSATEWWTRSPNGLGSTQVIYVKTDGGNTTTSYSTSYGVRPAFILPSDTLVDASGNVIA